MSYLSKYLVLGILLFSLTFGCVFLVTKQGKDAISVWQHQGDTWDVWYSVWDHDSKKWYVPGGGVSAPVATDAGDDNDPDVSSNDKEAIAVWSKATGGNTIYYSIWENDNWTRPAKLSTGDTDTDPTVAMDPAGNALAVWVSGGKFLTFSYYKKGTGWSTPQKVPATLGKVSLPELTYNTMDGLYYLVFTGNDGASTNAYAAGYGATIGWSNIALLGKGAVLDNDVPTAQRTGISAAEGKNEVTAVWPGSDGNVYSAKLGKAAKNFNDGKMPDDAYDSNDVANGAFNRANDLFHQIDVNDANSGVNLISGLLESDDRPSLTFIRDREVGLAVWWTKVIAPGEIYYSYYENGQWQGAGALDPSLAGQYDRNPAVTPLRERKAVIEIPFCGDGILDWPWEQCEIGIPCPFPNQVCNLATCQCEEVPYNYTCAENTFATIFGGPVVPPGVLCADDCAATFGAGWECEPVSCLCFPPPPPPPEESCAGNTIEVKKIDVNNFNPATMKCKDDCKALGPEYKCNVQSCTCTKPPPNETISCKSNTWVVNVPKGQVAAGVQCKDDCKELGSTYVCDPEGCFCKETRTVTPRCGDGYVSGPNVPGGGFEECDVGFGFYQPKDANGTPYHTPDTCPPPTKCNPSTCECVYPVENDTVCDSGFKVDSFFDVFFCIEIPKCGDGKVTSNEQCDWANASTNKCSAGNYCTNSCECKKLETSPRCGDGKISVETGEQCDGGSVNTNICQSGYTCYTPECACVPEEGFGDCGDGSVVPPEECDHGNTFTAQCPSGKSCYSCECVDPSTITHTECDFAHGQCVKVQGPGQDECTSDSQCEEEEEIEPVCGNGEQEAGEACDGNDDSNCDSGQSCNENCQCQTTTTITYHFECQENACVQVQGPGSSECNSDDDCVPPVIDCPAYCEGQGYSQSLGGGYSSASACQAAAAESAQTCTTKCVYSKFYSASNQAGTTTCCCKDVKVFACSDCPGQNPECPDPDVICPANQP